MAAPAMPVAPAAASVAPPATITSSLCPSLTPRPADVRREVQKEIKNLESKDENSLLKATASLVMLATLPESVSHLSLAIPHLVPLFHSAESLNVRKNACAALTSIMNSSPMLYLSVVQSPGLVQALVHCLKGVNQFVDESVQINAAAALSVLAQREEGLNKIQEASADDALISILPSSADGEKLAEEVVDAICALASHGSMRPILVQKGVVPKVARLVAASSSETCVRALLALGMLCGSSPSAQIELAEAQGAIQTLLRLVRSKDSDIQSISRDIFKMLSVNENTRPLVELSLRNSSS